MDLFSDIIAAVYSDINAGSESDLFDTATIKLNINRAYIKAAGMFKWPSLRDSKETSTQNGYEYYDYPQNWKSDSIWKLKVDGTDYGDPLAFKDYLFEQENNYQNGNTQIWSNENRRFFISPVPTTNGNNNIELWGMKSANNLVLDGDTTIFSYSSPECNVAIALEALAICRLKGGEQPVRMMRYIQGALLLSVEAQQILTTAWSKIAAENAKYEKTIPLFDVPDMFAGRSNNSNALRNKIGNF